MLSLRNPFAHSSTPSPAGMPSEATDPYKAVKRWQLEQGRTRKRVEELTSQLDAARLALSHAERAVGDLLVEELDATAATTSMKVAGDRVRVLESALSVAQQKDATAQAELQRAERQVAIDVEEAALTENKAVALQFDAAIEVVNRLALAHARTWNAVKQAGGSDTYGSPCTDAALQLQLFLNLAAHPMTGVGHAPKPFMKFSRFSECAPEPSYARTRKRK